MSLPSEPPPEPEPKRRVIRPWERPETEFPAVVPVGTLPFEPVEPSAVAVTGVLAYSNGFEFFVTRLLRPDSPGFGYGRGPGPPRLRTGGPSVEQSFEIGVQFADGSQASADGHVPGDVDEPAGPVLHFGGSVGSLYRGDARWWVWPLPPPGRLDFICRLDATETRVSIDAQLILDASRQSGPVWPSA